MSRWVVELQVITRDGALKRIRGETEAANANEAKRETVQVAEASGLTVVRITRTWRVTDE